MIFGGTEKLKVDGLCCPQVVPRQVKGGALVHLLQRILHAREGHIKVLGSQHQTLSTTLDFL